MTLTFCICPGMGSIVAEIWGNARWKCGLKTLTHAESLTRRGIQKIFLLCALAPLRDIFSSIRASLVDWFFQTREANEDDRLRDGFGRRGCTFSFGGIV